MGRDPVILRVAWLTEEQSGSPPRTARPGAPRGFGTWCRLLPRAHRPVRDPLYDQLVTSVDSTTRDRQAWVDAANGVAGDMLLGALLDAGAALDTVVRAIEAVLPDTVRLTVRTVQRAGLRATKVDVSPLVTDHHHRDWTTIRTLITEANLPDSVRQQALAVFAALAAAEARAHGIDIERVHFHEVGAWDSIADVVGVCAAIHDLGLGRLTCGVIGLGSGTVRRRTARFRCRCRRSSSWPSVGRSPPQARENLPRPPGWPC